MVILIFLLTFILFCCVIKYCIYRHNLDYYKVNKGLCGYADCQNKIGLNSKYCSEHTLDFENLIVKKSNIPKAGYGLFAGPKGFKKGEKIVLYGYKHNELSMDEFKKTDDTDYMICDDDICWDGKDRKYSVGRYSNDCYKSKFKCNAHFKIINKQAYIYAMRDIKPYSEIFTDYGPDYWKYK